MLGSARSFFQERGILEVDCSALVPFPAIDSNIDVIEAFPFENTIGYLHTSPEYAMKKLLSLGSTDLFYLGHVFRKEEKGRFHQPEFTMAEWYRLGFTLPQMMEETADFLRLFLKNLPLEVLSYQDAFENFLEIDPEKASFETLLKYAEPLGGKPSWSREELLQLLLSHLVEPHLGKDCLTALTDYPPNEAALAKIVEKKGRKVALRFEIYHKGVELTNGYAESPNAKEIRNRFHETNLAREKAGKSPYPIDESFLESLDKNFPDCCGVSVGFDRAFALSLNLDSISACMVNPWKH